MSSSAISTCHECCAESLCNRKLCGVLQSNDTNLACLIGNEVRGFPSYTSIAYCKYREQCYARQQHGRARPNEFNYGCASQIACERLSEHISDAGSATMCQRCCGEDGCNAYICYSNVQDPQTTLSIKVITTASTTTSTMTSTLTSTITSTSASTTDTTTTLNTFTDCWDLQTQGGYHTNGIYDIYPSPADSHVRVRCDMTTDGGGWTILQRRFDGSLSFTRTFQEYEEGFGDVTGEYWVGLHWIHVLTTQGTVQMRTDLCGFNRQAGYAVFSGFAIAGQNDTYRPHKGAYMSGSLTDRLFIHDGRVFQATGVCASRFRGGWWYGSGSIGVNLNGGAYGSASGIAWYNVPDHTWSTWISSELKIRPIMARGDPTHPYPCHT